MFHIKKLLFGSLPPDKAANKLTWEISKSSFKFFRDENFKKLVNFSGLEQIEQDRIFNEIVVTGISLAILMLEALSKLTSGEKSDYMAALKNKMDEEYSNILRGFGTGIEEYHLDMWQKLIKMRCDEYRRDYREMYKEFSEPKERNGAISVTAIGGLRHIRRGKTNPQDELFKYSLAWTRTLAINIEKLLIRAI